LLGKTAIGEPALYHITTGKQFIIYMTLHFALFGDKYNLNFGCRFFWQSQREAAVSWVLQVMSMTQYCCTRALLYSARAELKGINQEKKEKKNA
jgi:hypothetical protein